MITQNHIIIVIFIEFAVFYLALYSILNASKWVQEKQQIVDELFNDVAHSSIEFRQSLSLLNQNLDSKFKVQPLDYKELGSLASSIFSDLVNLRLSPGGLFKKKFIVLNIVTKLWSYRKRIYSTILSVL